MRLPCARALACLVCSIGVARAWGVVGHQIVATIAQIHLFDDARAHARAIARGDLAPIAPWPDRIRRALPWSASLHYVGPLDEHPPADCTFGHGWKSDRNVFSAVANYSARLDARTTDAAARDDLSFLVHFVADLHQPLHLTSRNRGGNSDLVVFEGRHTSLHALWDTGLIARALRNVHNYTRPLPSRQIEDALRSSIYDSYIRWLLVEGVGQWWRAELPAWLNCTTTLPTSWTPDAPQLVLQERVACPVQWAEPVHRHVCSDVYPADYDDVEGAYVLPPAYGARLAGEKVIERLLVMAGLRLAAVLNTLLVDDDALHARALPVDLGWLETLL